MTTTQQDHAPRTAPSADALLALLARRTVAHLATVSDAGRPHSAAVLYAAVGSTLYVSTDTGSRKARNIAANPHVGVSIPVRRLPVGPPSSIQFQARATLLDRGCDEITALAAAGRIDGVTGHGELDREGACFVRVEPGARVHTYGLGMSLLHLLRHPLDAAGTVLLPA
jgi:hypothetical protein